MATTHDPSGTHRLRGPVEAPQQHVAPPPHLHQMQQPEPPEHSNRDRNRQEQCQQKLPFQIVYASSWAEENPPDQLAIQNHSPLARGWQTARYCTFPQTLCIRFISGPARIRKLQILSHHFKIATRIELSVGNRVCLGNDAAGRWPSRQASAAYLQDNMSRQHLQRGHGASAVDGVHFTRLGYIKLDSNDRSQFKSRELKSVPLEARGEYLKLVLVSCHVNELNLYNQASIVALNVIGEVLEKSNSSFLEYAPSGAPSEIGNDPAAPEFADADVSMSIAANLDAAVWGLVNKTPDYCLAGPARDQSVEADLSFAISHDAETSRMLRALRQAKETAVAGEDFMTAKSLKKLMEAFGKAGEVIASMEAQKRTAVEQEDFDAAESFRVEIASIRSAMAKRLSEEGFRLDEVGNITRGMLPPIHGQPDFKSAADMRDGSEIIDQPRRDQRGQEQAATGRAFSPPNATHLKYGTSLQHPRSATANDITPRKLSPSERVAPMDATLRARALPTASDDPQFTGADIRLAAEPLPADARPIKPAPLPSQAYERPIKPAHHPSKSDERPIKPAVALTADDDRHTKTLSPPQSKLDRSPIKLAADGDERPIKPAPGMVPPVDEKIEAETSADRSSPPHLKVKESVIPSPESVVVPALRMKKQAPAGPTTSRPPPVTSVPPDPLGEEERVEHSLEVSVFGEQVVAGLVSKKFQQKATALEWAKTHLDTWQEATTNDLLQPDKATVIRAAYAIIRDLLPDSREKLLVSVFSFWNAILDFCARNKIPVSSNFRELEPIFPMFMAKLSDTNPRVREAARAVLLRLARELRSSPHSLMPLLCGKGTKVSAPPKIMKARAECVREVVNEIGMAKDDEQICADLAKQCLTHASGEVRDAGANLFADLYPVIARSTYDAVLSTVNPALREVVEKKTGASASASGSPSPRAKSTRASAENLNNAGSMTSVRSRNAGRNVVKGKKVGGDSEVEKRASRSTKEMNKSVSDETVQDANKTCIFCEEQNSTFTEDILDQHYWRDCPMLTNCVMCKLIVEISGLTGHMLSDCEASKSVKKCSRCGMAVPAEQLGEHLGTKSCPPSVANVARCPLCLLKISPDTDSSWREHLLKNGCSKNPRTRKKLSTSPETGAPVPVGASPISSSEPSVPTKPLKKVAPPDAGNAVASSTPVIPATGSRIPKLKPGRTAKPRGS